MSEPLKYLVSIIRLCSFALLIYFLFFCFFVVFQDVRFCPLLLCLIFFVLFCCRLPRCMILFLYVVCSVFSSSTVNKFPRKRLLHFFFRVRNLKKRGGKQGRTGGGGGGYMHCLTVQCYPIMIVMYMYARVLYFFSRVSLKKRVIWLHDYV